MDKTIVTLGCDPELFMQGIQGVVSAIGRIEGTKEEPHPIKTGFIQHDNVALEFNIPIAKSVSEFDEFIQNVLVEISEIVASQNCSISNKASAILPEHELEDYRAWLFGCDPDFNAWSGKLNKISIKPQDLGGFRTAGGHVHIGFKNDPTFEEQMQFVKCCDLFLGLPAVFVEDLERKKLYGKAGAFRPKDFGVEYRTLSNFWIFKPEYRVWVAHTCIMLASIYNSIDVPLEVQDIINTSDIERAKELIAKFNIKHPF